MKKILLLSAVLLGAVTASQAGVHVNIGIPLPAPPVVVTPPAPVYVQPPQEACEEPPVVYAPAPVVVAPPVVGFSFGYRGPAYRPYSYHPDYHRDWHHDDHRDWNHHDNDRGHYRR